MAERAAAIALAAGVRPNSLRPAALFAALGRWPVAMHARPRYNGGVSFTRKIIDSARTGIHSVMDKVVADDTPLSHVSEEGFERELKRRIAARNAHPIQPMDNPRARLASASPETSARRAKLSEERDARIRAVREQRERAARAAQDEALRRAKEQAAREGARGPSAGSSRPGAGAGSRSQGRRPGGTPFSRTDDKIAEYYKVLNLPYGADLTEVKSSYRKLMRKYHPDRHVGDPKKLKAATELSMRVTQAYNELQAHLGAKK